MVDMDEWADYYTNPENIEKIANSCKYREIVIMRYVNGKKIVLRPCKVFKKEHLQYYINRLNLAETPFDIYCSCASVRMPKLPADLSKLKEMRQYLNIHWNELLTGYDIFIDVDIEKAEHRMQARAWTGILVKELQEKGYKKMQAWDTSRGYHCQDMGRFTPDFVKQLVMNICCEKQIPMSYPVKQIGEQKYYAKDGKWIKVKPNFTPPPVPKPNIDTSIYDWRRIFRVNYSLHSKTGKPKVRII